MLQSNQKIIRHKVGLLNLAEELGKVSKPSVNQGAKEFERLPCLGRGCGPHGRHRRPT